MPYQWGIVALKSLVMNRTFGSIILMAGFGAAAFGQPEVMAWGNLTGLRVDGHLLELSTSMCIAQPEMAGVSCTGREKQQNSYSRNGKIETVTVQMRTPREFREPGSAGWVMTATEVVEDTGPATAKVDLEFTSPAEADIGGAFFGIELPAPVFSGGSVELIDPDPPTAARTSLAAGEGEQNEYLRATATGARFISRSRQIEVTFNEATQIIVRDDRRKGSYTLQVLLAVLTGKTTAGQSGKKSFSFKVTSEIDKNPVEITLDASHPGQMFDGFGGNFRLQNARTDPPVIDYSLENIRIAWGRVELPWSIWHPDEATDPLAAARAGNVNPRVVQAMEMARRLAQKRNAGHRERVASAELGDPRRRCARWARPWRRRHRSTAANRAARQSAQPREDGPHQGLHRRLPAVPQGKVRRGGHPVQLQRIRSGHRRPSNPARARGTHQDLGRLLRRQGTRHQARAGRHLGRQPHRFHQTRHARSRGGQVRRRGGFPLLARMHR